MANLVAPTVAWESRRPLSFALLPVFGSVVQSPDGGWAIDTDGNPADGYITAAAEGGVQVDDAAVGGMDVRLLNNQPIAY